MIAIRGTLSLPRDLSNGQDGVDARASIIYYLKE
jgi:hypothetical protein